MPLPQPISVEDFFRPPVRAAAKISPDGTRIAYLAPWQNRLNIWVENVDGSETRCVTADENRSIYIYEWTGDSRWLLYMQDTGGDEYFHVYRADPDDPAATAVDLTPFPGVRTSFELLKGRPGKVMVQLNKRTSTLMDAAELDIATGELTELAQNPGTVTNWQAGPNGDLFTSTQTAEGDIEIARWDSAAKTLRTIATYDGADYPLGIHPISVSPDGTGLWFGSNKGTDRTRLVRLDVATGEETEVDSHPSFDLATQVMLPFPLILSEATGELIGARYYGERQVIHALDPQFAAVLEGVSRLNSGDIGSLSSDSSGARWVVSFFSDRDPGVTYFYDHATGQSRKLFRPHPHLDPDTLAPMTPVTIPARDGLDLPSYLTLPVGIPQENLPMVLLVHGGPWARDCWYYQPEVQLLANRGYAVLQVNFRGSTGFGKAFTKAAIGEFAGKMHDDLIDAVDWAVKQGYADRDRVAIFGGSYGGYAALVGVTFTPDVFAAAIDYVGISSLANFMRTLPDVARPFLANNWHRYVGDHDDPVQEADMLARSPITRVDQIRAPLLVIQGANDTRVVQAESDNLVEALRARGVEVEYMVKDDEGHGFVNPENRIDLFHAVERFLAEHL
ncbi:S9 family peptidase [Mycolicibacterium smegmatis]|uniref:Peptidase n=2 Tax=Mycolicibacterium smegmatis (strain ATCC 700084 / mc(2)155) TaxID=246196 RepID=A0R3M2_MYCS2|nr:S9 family peptidase [Mycolicibacterium smegmatis]ABK75051.1 peptidase [Mycolicibacterium smegmatis MC2 155]AFP41812.1 Peptidase S9, prolyl oligopeptidase active site region [Mycolicibacterium smegmatis MC2 155]AIU10542.1 peptidase [Mycolicibacterium smegmatis MC2 155]AIU17167.1 peptidase [Mycolicibacterium smegmatis]AIU23790.1 peptidase [Mycolicibacterium smegmatis]